MEGVVVSINISDKKGVRKKEVPSVILKEQYGIEGDAHASKDWHRQVSLLSMESIGKMVEKGLDVGPGDFAENITIRGIDITTLPIGTKMVIGEDVEIEITQLGKVCHNRCAIFYQAGDCVMPKEGVFAKVLKGGRIKKGDVIKVLDYDKSVSSNIK
ncbi:MAG: MOSC domain-containing protein [Nitrospirae bacterium]|nr:MAG: MOSC domain-containing protein [Nitrospirota bacterium]